MYFLFMWRGTIYYMIYVCPKLSETHVHVQDAPTVTVGYLLYLADE